MAAVQASTRRPRLTNLSHFASYAHDIEKSIAFYRYVLGYEDISRQADRAVVRINDLQYVELVPEREPGTDRLERFGFVTDDAEAMRAWLASRGVEVPEKIEAGDHGSLSFSVKDPDGHVVEFVQHRPARRPDARRSHRRQR